MQKYLGKTFLHPLIDYLLIGGGLSLIAIPFIVGMTKGGAFISLAVLPMVMLLSNSAHFAASTVRLYTKENCYEDFPKLTMLFPLITVMVLTIAIIYPENIGITLQALYLTWSPYHYARQAYGLSVMYCYRSNCQLTLREKRILLAASLLPFFMIILSKENAGLLWVFPIEKVAGIPPLYLGLYALTKLLPVMSFILPCLLYLHLLRSSQKKAPMPLISLLVVLTNAVWWLVFDYQAAFIWATVFHGIQYLAIMLIFHVRDKMKSDTSGRGPMYHGLSFYLACLLLGYLLFQCWPYFYVWAGFGLAESMLLVIAVINIHHFIVDGYIWKLRKDPNYQIVIAAPTAAEATGR